MGIVLSGEEQCRNGVRWLAPYGPDRRFFTILDTAAVICVLLCLGASLATLVYGKFINPAGFHIGPWHSSRLHLPLGSWFVGAISIAIWSAYFQTVSRQDQVEHDFQRVQGRSPSFTLERIRAQESSGYAIRLECEIDAEQGPVRVQPFVSAALFSTEQAAEAYLRRLNLNNLTVAVNPEDPREVFVLPWDERQGTLCAVFAVASSVAALVMLIVSLT